VLANLPRVGVYVIAGQAAGRPWQAVAKRAGLNGVRIHDLRHTHASVGAGAAQRPLRPWCGAATAYFWSKMNA
jgi:integrase